jgi:ABC-type uncharacterized transport system substrate-binding protein
LSLAQTAFNSEVATISHLPALYVRGEFVDADGLMSYGVNYPDMYRSAVGYIAKIPKGAKASDLPVWTARRQKHSISLSRCP